MEKKRSIEMTIILLSLCFSTFTFAETIILKSGQKIEAKIIEKTDEYIVIDFYGSHVSYNMDEIEKIEEKKSIPPTEEIETSISPKEISPKQLEPEKPSTYLNEKYGVKVVLPKDWFVVPEETSSIEPGRQISFLVIAYRYDPEVTDNASNPYIKVEVVEYEHNPPTLTILKLAAQMDVKSSGGKFIDPPDEIIINELKALQYVGERKTRNSMMVESICIFKRGNKYCRLIYFCNTEDFPKYKEDFEKVVNSFEFR